MVSCYQQLVIVMSSLWVFILYLRAHVCPVVFLWKFFTVLCGVTHVGDTTIFSRGDIKQL